MRKYTLYLTSYILLAACGGPSVPTDYIQKDLLPAIYPDYAGVTVPVNIAPLTFEYDGQTDEMVVRFAVDNDDIVCDGQPTIDEWHELTQKAKGKAVSVEVYTRNGKEWTRFKPFNIFRLYRPLYQLSSDCTIVYHLRSAYNQPTVPGKLR